MPSPLGCGGRMIWPNPIAAASHIRRAVFGHARYQRPFTYHSQRKFGIADMSFPPKAIAIRTAPSSAVFSKYIIQNISGDLGFCRLKFGGVFRIGSSPRFYGSSFISWPLTSQKRKRKKCGANKANQFGEN
jgi:hypothetical protein